MAKRTLGKRILAIVLSLVMCFSTIQLTVFADSYKNQVMSGSYVLNEDGTIADITDTTNTAAHGFTLSKSIAQTGKDAFEVTLNVKTSTTVVTNDAAVLLVIDASNSMENMVSATSTRLAAVKNALTKDNGFVDSLTNNSGKIFLSVVYFNSNAYTAVDWIELNSENKATIKTAINNIKSSSGTNVEAGLMLARNKLGMGAISSCGSKYTVLLSDGAPSHYMSGDSTNTSQITRDNSGGFSENYDTIYGGIEMANAVKAKSTLYTICYGAASTALNNPSTGTCTNCGNAESSHQAGTRYCASNTTYQRISTINRDCKHCGDDANSHVRIGNTRYCVADTTFATSSNSYTFSTVGQYLANAIASSGACAYNANDEATVNSAFSSIASSASSGMTGAGTKVTDPMGQYIVLGDISGMAGVTASGNTLSWALDKNTLIEEKVTGNTTEYTYQIQYPITLDTAAEGFQEFNGDGTVKYYPANGYTYLSVDINNQTVTIPFNVPGVCGEIPEYNWKIEYYLQNEQGGYTLDETKDMGAVDLHASVSAPSDYATKYANRYYSFAFGATTIQITAGENVMKLYYNYDMANATVNHFYKTDIINADGSRTDGEYPANPQLTSTKSVRVDTLFGASAQPIYGGFTYTLEDVDPRNAELTVSADSSKNVINFYYTRQDDRRAETSAQVNHIYNTYGYVLKDGKYVLDLIASVTEIAQSNTNLRATTTYVVNGASPLAGYESFSLNAAKGDYASLLQSDNTLSFKLADSADANVRTLVFEKVVDDRVPVQVTVNHHYTKSTTSVQDGNVVTTIDPNNELGKTESFTGYYVGESFAATQYNTYEGDTYISDADNATKCATKVLTGNTTIDLYYNLVVAPNPVSITVNHYWRTYTDVTVEKVDPETGKVIGTEVVKEVSLDHAIENIAVNDLLPGQSYTAALLSREGGYTFNTAESNRTISVSAGAVINLYYDRNASDDIRDDASIDVLHKYTTYLTTIVGGSVNVVTLSDGTVSESFPAEGGSLKTGDSFTAIANPIYKENSYTQITDNGTLSVILQPGTNGTIVIEYVREISDLVDTSYNVNYEYRTYTMTVNAEGKAGYWDAPAVDTTGSVANIAGYVGQQVTLSAGAKEGFSPLPGNPATVQILKAEDNTWTFVYEKYIPLGFGSVTVNHHYKTTTIAENGTASTETEDVLGTATQMYLGEHFLAQNVPGSFQLVSATMDGREVAAQDVAGVIQGAHVVDFYYEKTVDNSKLANYSISHIYNLYTYNGQLISSSQSDPITGSGFVTTPVTAIPSPSGYTQVSSTYNGSALAAPYTISLADGENVIVFVYEMYEPRAELDVSVIHNYHQDLDALTNGTANETYTVVESGISEDSNYTATVRNVAGYAFHSANPSNMTIFVTEGQENVIIINYVRIVEVEEEEPPVVEPPVVEPPVVEPPVVEPPVVEPPVVEPPVVEPPVVEPPVVEPPVVEPPVVEPPVVEPPVVEPPVVEPPVVEPPVVDIPDEEVPLVDIPDEDVPLAEVPKTGDATVLYAALTTLSGVGLAALTFGKKKEEDSAE